MNTAQSSATAISSITVREILEIESLSTMRLIAGAEGLDRVVRSVNVMEVPDIENWVSASELLLTTAYSIRNDMSALCALIPMLAHKDLSGLVIKCRYIYDIPQEMIDAADKYQFPLIEMPSHLSHAQVIKTIYGTIASRQLGVLQFISQLRYSMTMLVINGGQFQDVCKMLYDHYNYPVCITDTKYHPLASCAFPEWVLKTARSSYIPKPESSASPVEQINIIPYVYSGKQYSITELPIRIGNVTHGHVLSLVQGDTISEQYYITLEQISLIAALVFSRQISIREVEVRYTNAFLFDWLHGTIKTGDQFSARASAIGWELDGSFDLLVAEVVHTGTILSFEQSYEINSSMRNAIRSALFNSPNRFYMGMTDNRLILLLQLKGDPGARRQEIGELLQNIKAALPRELALNIKFAAGRPRTDPLMLHKTYSEAVRALTIGMRFMPHKELYFFDDLGLYSLLGSIEPSEMTRIIERIYKPLYEYDQTHKSNLIETAKCFFECGGVISQVAKTMFLHYNTVNYRMKQIFELVDADMKNYEDRLLVQLAIILGDCYYI